MVELDAAKVVAFVHAKGTSDRLPGKNLKILGDRPLICHAIANALAARLVDAVVIDSEDDEILRVGREAGAIPLKRRAGLATNETTGDDLARWQAGSVPEARGILQVVPTSPFIGPVTLDHVILRLSQSPRFDTITGVYSDRVYRWVNDIPAYGDPLPNSKDIPPITFETTGLYVMRRAYVMEHGRRVSHLEETRGRWNLTQIEAIDINTQEDFDFAEIVWKGMQC